MKELENCLRHPHTANARAPFFLPQPHSRGPPNSIYWPASRNQTRWTRSPPSSSAANFQRVTLSNRRAPFCRRGPPSAASGEGRGRRGRRGVTRSMVTTLGPKMAAEWGGGAGYSGSGPGRSRWRWSGSMWVRSVLLLLGGLRASATSTPVSLGSSPPCRHHVPSDTEVGRQGRERALSG